MRRACAVYAVVSDLGRRRAAVSSCQNRQSRRASCRQPSRPVNGRGASSETAWRRRGPSNSSSDTICWKPRDGEHRRRGHRAGEDDQWKHNARTLGHKNLVLPNNRSFSDLLFSNLLKTQKVEQCSHSANVAGSARPSPRSASVGHGCMLRFMMRDSRPLPPRHTATTNICITEKKHAAN